MILLVDNYDSFTWNLVQAFRSLGAPVEVVRHDSVDAADARRRAPRAVVISPGPKGPAEAGRSAEIVRELGPRVPVLGVCLGLQVIAEVFGGRVRRAGTPMHGKTSRVTHGGRGIFAGLPSPMEAMRYHSLAVEASSLPSELELTASSEEGEVMGLRHREWPVEGVQFHPESYRTPEGLALLRNFLRSAGR